MKTIARYASLVKFSHTIFALPFAMIGFVYGVVSLGGGFDILLLVKVLAAMIAARNMAMGFNRWIDRDIDARNERTAMREIPRGAVSPRNALWFVIFNAVIFVAVAWWINPLALYLSPVAIVVLLGYSYTKRFTSLCHLVLGLALAIAPVGAYIAVTGAVSAIPVWISVVVLTWVSGFDIIYALQDITFDRQNGLHSIPACLGIGGSLAVSIFLHLLSIGAVIIIGEHMDAGVWYWAGTCLFVAVLIYQHIKARPSRLAEIGADFGVVNGIASVGYAACFIVDMLV